MNEKNDTLYLLDIVDSLKKNFRYLITCSFIGFLVSVIISFFLISPKYSATIDILVSQKSDSIQAQYTTQQADLQAINTYKDVIQKAVVLEPVVKELKQKNNFQGSVESLQKLITVNNQNNSQVFSVTVSDTNAYMAADIANTIGSVFSKKIKQMMKIDNVTIVTKATPDLTPVSPNKKMNALIGLAVGLLIGVGIVIIKYLRDTTVKSPDFLADELGLTYLGFVYNIEDEDEGLHVVKILNANVQANTQPEQQRRRRV